MTYEASDDLTLSFQGFLTKMSQTNYGSTSNPGNARAVELPIFRGTHPGNPFLAKNAAGQQLYGVDANGGTGGIFDGLTQEVLSRCAQAFGLGCGIFQDVSRSALSSTLTFGRAGPLLQMQLDMPGWFTL